MTVPGKRMASQRYSLKLQINRTLERMSDRQNAVLHSWSYYAIFAWFDDDIVAMYGALGNWLYVIRTCASLFFSTLIALDSHTFVYAFEDWLCFGLFWNGLFFFFSIYMQLFLWVLLYFLLVYCIFKRLFVRWIGKWWNNLKLTHTHNENKNQIKIESNKSIRTLKKCKCDHFLVRINTVDQCDSNPFSFFLLLSSLNKAMPKCRRERITLKHIQKQWCALNFLE